MDNRNLKYGEFRSFYETRVRNETNSQLPGFGRLAIWDQPPKDYDEKAAEKRCAEVELEITRAMDLDNANNPSDLFLAFAEYLYEKYGVSKWDAEFLCGLAFESMFRLASGDGNFDVIRKAASLGIGYNHGGV